MNPFRVKFQPEEFFILSDKHLQHKNICKGTSVWEEGYRDFASPDVMNELIVANINATVPENAVLFDLGDGLFGDKKQARYWRSRIKCNTIIYLFGNHCEWIRKDSNLQNELFSWCGDYLEIYVGKQLVCMSHYAPSVWNESHRGSWYCYGHSHGSFPDDVKARKLDVGMDNEYSLVNGRLVMTTNFSREPIWNKDEWNELYVGYREIPDNQKQSILHKRFHPFSFNDLKLVMGHKKFGAVDHHNKRDMQ